MIGENDVSKVSAEMLENINEMTTIMNTLGEDCEELYALIQNGAHPRDQRSFIRSVFALLEGVLYRKRVMALHINHFFNGLDSDEIAALEGKSYQLNERGKVVVKERFDTFLPSFKFTFKVFAKSSNSEFTLTYGGKGWQKLRQALEVRDRLMHPKESKDLEVTKDEVEAAHLAYNWFVAASTLAMAHFMKVAKPKMLNTAKLDYDSWIPQLEARVKEIES